MTVSRRHVSGEIFVLVGKNPTNPSSSVGYSESFRRSRPPTIIKKRKTIVQPNAYSIKEIKTSRLLYDDNAKLNKVENGIHRLQRKQPKPIFIKTKKRNIGEIAISVNTIEV